MPLVRQSSMTHLMPLALLFGWKARRARIPLQGSILLAQPALDLLEQRFDFFTCYSGIATTGIDEREKEAECPGELRHPLGMKLHPDPPASGSYLLESLNHAIRGRSSHLHARCQ